MLKCNKHPKYKGVFEPKASSKYPKGCPDCWWIYANQQAKKKGYNLNYEETIGLGSLGSVYNYI